MKKNPVRFKVLKVLLADIKVVDLDEYVHTISRYTKYHHSTKNKNCGELECYFVCEYLYNIYDQKQYKISQYTIEKLFECLFPTKRCYYNREITCNRYIISFLRLKISFSTIFLRKFIFVT